MANLGNFFWDFIIVWDTVPCSSKSLRNQIWLYTDLTFLCDLVSMPHTYDASKALECIKYNKMTTTNTQKPFSWPCGFWSLREACTVLQDGPFAALKNNYWSLNFLQILLIFATKIINIVNFWQIFLIKMAKMMIFRLKIA